MVTRPRSSLTLGRCYGTVGEAVADAHDRIVRTKLRFIESLTRDRVQPEGEKAVDVLLALADTRSGLGRWIRGDDADPQACASVASFVFVGGDALLFLGDIPSYPGLVVMVVTKDDRGCFFRFICGVPGSYSSA